MPTIKLFWIAFSHVVSFSFESTAFAVDDMPMILADGRNDEQLARELMMGGVR